MHGPAGSAPSLPEPAGTAAPMALIAGRSGLATLTVLVRSGGEWLGEADRDLKCERTRGPRLLGA